MYMTPKPEILSQLCLMDGKIGDEILFCPECLFQYPPRTGTIPMCPRCLTRLNITKIDQELIDLIKNARLISVKKKIIRF